MGKAITLGGTMTAPLTPVAGTAGTITTATTGPGKISPLATIVHLVATLVGAAIVALSASHTGVHGEAAQSTGLAAGALVVLGSAWKYLQSHDKALAGNLEAVKAWGAAHAPALESAISDAKAVVAALPENLQSRLSALEAQASTLEAKVTAAAGTTPSAVDDLVRKTLGLPDGTPVTDQMRQVVAGHPNAGA